MKNKRKGLRIFLASLLAVLLLGTAGFLAWAGDYYHADETALAAEAADDTLAVQGDYTILTPDIPSQTGIVFYPGAKVEAVAYLPLLEKLKARGYTCVLVKMPLNMAIFDADAADGAMAAVPGITHWYIAGHSMGGAMASSYAAANPGKIEGLILLGAYIYGDYPAAKTLTVYGTFNADLEKHIDYTENIVKIEGGNHAQFGCYGRQKGDPDATISAETQQTVTAEAIDAFIQKNGGST